MYAGPDPEIAVTASWRYSGTSATLPVAASSALASSSWAGLTCRPAETAADYLRFRGLAG